VYGPTVHRYTMSKQCGDECVRPHVLDVKLGVWKELNPGGTVPSPRAGHAGTVYAGRYWCIVGGRAWQTLLACSSTRTMYPLCHPFIPPVYPLPPIYPLYYPYIPPLPPIYPLYIPYMSPIYQ
jgi:hypothetical protein